MTKKPELDSGDLVVLSASIENIDGSELSVYFQNTQQSSLKTVINV